MSIGFTNKLSETMTGVRYAPLLQNYADNSSLFMYDYKSSAMPNKRSGGSNNKPHEWIYGSFSAEYDRASRLQQPQSILSQLASVMIQIVAYSMCVATFPFSALLTFKLVQQYERMVVYRLGRLCSLKGPGVIVVLPCIDKCQKVDLRTKAFNVPPATLATADAYLITVGASINFRVCNPILMSLSVQDINRSVRDIAQSCMTNLLCKKQANVIMSKRLALSYDLQVDINIAAQEWGLEVSGVELSQVNVIAKPKEQPSGFDDASLYGGLLTAAQQVMQQAKHPAESSPPTTSSEENPLPVESSADALFATIERCCLNRDIVRNVGVVYEFVVSNALGGAKHYLLDLKHGSGAVVRGSRDRPDGCAPTVTIRLSEQVLGQLIGKQMTLFSAYTTGRLHVDGNHEHARKLSHILDVVNSALQITVPSPL